MPPPYGTATCPFAGPNVCPAGVPLVLFMSLIGTLMPKFPQFCENKPIYDSYDFIVVGSGAAGSIIAARLSEVQDWKVLLIEAGPEEPLNAQVPSLTANFLGTNLDWNYTTTGEKNACLAKGGKCSWPRGKNLGGTTAHHGMMYVRGNKKDYDNWAMPGWYWKEVMPYFLRSEDNGDFKNEYHTTGGPLKLARFPWQPPIAEDILRAGAETECGRSEDLNGKQITGFAVTQTHNNKGVRASSATAFLRPVRNRKNLHVLLKARVSRILFEKDTAVGVEYIKNGKKLKVRADKEVILSAGAIGSPQILLLSGVGPAKDLKALKIPVVKGLPGVGKNLQNHVSVSLRYRLNIKNDDSMEDAVKQYKRDNTGPMSSTGMSQMTGICASNATSPDYPDLQFYFHGYVQNCKEDTRENRVIRVVPTYLHCKSRGTLKLASKDPEDNPVITQNYLSRQEDIDGVLAGVKLAQKLFESAPLKKYQPELILDTVEACDHIKGLGRDYWTCILKQNTDPENHQVGTCKMGVDKMAVVDPKLRVIGLKRLRVADAAIIPTMTSGNTVAPIMMIGERVSDFIKMAHFQQKSPPGAKKMSDRQKYPYTPYLYKARRKNGLKLDSRVNNLLNSSASFSASPRKV